MTYFDEKFGDDNAHENKTQVPPVIYSAEIFRYDNTVENKSYCTVIYSHEKVSDDNARIIKIIIVRIVRS